MGKFKIVYDRNSCIGAGTCTTISKEFWTMGHDGKASLKGAKTAANGMQELVLDDAEVKREQAVAGSCPSGCIKVEKA